MQSMGEGFRAVVVGASGGIGSAFATALARNPNCGDLLCLARSVGKARIDVTDAASVAEAAALAKEKLGQVDLLVDATGALQIDGHGPEKALDQIDPTVMARAFAINAIGPALLLKHFTPLMPRDRRAVFATLSARIGSIGDNRIGGWLSYRASKAALNQIVRTAAIEIARKRPQAVCVALHPGTVETPLSRSFIGNRETFQPDEAVAKLLEVLDRLQPADSGGQFDYAGERVAN